MNIAAAGTSSPGAFADMGLECHRPLGAFYAFPSVAKFGLPAKEFALKVAARRTVAVVPGTAFGECGEGFVRCAYATNLDNIKEAMVRLKRFNRCEVEREGGSTNYTADTRYTIFLQPAQMVVLTNTNYAIPLPTDTKTWTLKLNVRQQTSKESLINALYRWGVGTPRMLSRLSGPPKKDEAFRWTVCQSDSFEVSLETPDKQP
jgi:hypothetical protein